jgi:hypothetical protein
MQALPGPTLPARGVSEPHVMHQMRSKLRISSQSVTD